MIVKNIKMKALPGLLFVLSLTTGCGGFNQNNISIEQNGKLIKATNGVIVLNKEEFNIIFNFPKPMAVLVNASFNDRIFGLASEGKQLANLDEFDEYFTIAVALFNPEKVMYISEDSSSPWFYVSDREHNFNHIKRENGNYICTRSINNISDVDGSVKVENINAPIYLAFVPASNGEEKMDENIIQTNHLKIEWRE